MAGDQAHARICYIQGVNDKAVKKMVNTIFQMDDSYPCDLKDARKFGELDPLDKIERLKVETFDDPTLVILDESKPYQVVKTARVSANTRFQKTANMLRIALNRQPAG